MYGKRVFYFSFHKQIVHRGLTTNYATILAILHYGKETCDYATSRYKPW